MTDQTHASAAPSWPSRAAGWYATVLLTLAYTFSFLDRSIIAFMIEDIKRDFNLNHTQLGLLGGPAFALFYTLFGLPVGRWADTRSRRALIAAGFVLWSCMTAASGLARKFWQLLLCRVGFLRVQMCSFRPALIGFSQRSISFSASKPHVTKARSE